MMSFVGLVIAKQPEAAALCGKINYTEPNPEPSCETELFTFSVNSVYAIPMMLFSVLFLSFSSPLNKPFFSSCVMETSSQ